MYSSENYQLINYRFGGLISLYVDSHRVLEVMIIIMMMMMMMLKGFDNDIGGGTLTTAMVYLSGRGQY